jgi:outer membrane protein OmpA-like peptidoglycan-associated protein
LASRYLCVFALLFLGLSGCDKTRHDNAIQAAANDVLKDDGAPTEWSELEAEVSEGTVTVELPGWLAEDEANLKQALSNIQHVDTVNLPIDESAEQQASVLLVEQSQGGAWTLQATLPNEDAGERLVDMSENLFRTEQIDTDFTFSRKFAEPAWLGVYDAVISRLTGQVDQMKVRFEDNTVSIEGICISAPFCEELNREFESLNLALESDLETYALLKVSVRPDGLAVEGVLAESTDQDELLSCLFDDAQPLKKDEVKLSIAEDRRLPEPMYGYWCETLRVLRPPLSDYMAKFEGPRVQIHGEVETIDQFDAVLSALPSVRNFTANADIAVTNRVNHLKAVCNGVRWRVSGHLPSSGTLDAIREIIRSAEDAPAVSFDISTGDRSGVDAKTREAASLFPTLCHHVPNGELRLYSKELTLLGTASDPEELQPLREALNQLQRLEPHVRIRAHSNPELRRLQEELDALLERTPLTFQDYSAELDSNGERAIDALAEWMKANPGPRFEMVVHSDGPGSSQFHFQLSEARIQTIMNGIYNRQGDDHRIQPRAVGNEYPIADRTTESGQRENTRIDMMVLPGR